MSAIALPLPAYARAARGCELALVGKPMSGLGRGPQGPVGRRRFAASRAPAPAEQIFFDGQHQHPPSTPQDSAIFSQGGCSMLNEILQFGIIPAPTEWWSMADGTPDLVAAFIARNGVRRCPTACCCATSSATIPAADVVALEAHAMAIDGRRHAAAVAHQPPRVKILFGQSRRKDFTPSEAVSIKRELEPELETAAKQRQREHGGTAPGKHSGQIATSDSGRARDKAAAFTGFGARTLDKAEAIVAAAEAEPDQPSANLAEAQRGEPCANLAQGAEPDARAEFLVVIRRARRRIARALARAAR